MKIVALRSLPGICFVALLTQCGSRESQTPLALKWSEGKAVGLSIDKSILENLAEDSIPDLVKVRWAGIKEDLFMLGTYQTDGNRILFTPVIPLTRRLRYEVVYRGTVVGELEVPADGHTAPSVLAIYPSQDTVPENLLKMYIHFSEAMAEGRSLDHVILLRNNRDTMKGTFLDLQPELWNEDGTLLTLWLDPGRIKRDLIPNKKLGIPLTQGQLYTIQVSPQWKSKQGNPLPIGYVRTFFVGQRDERMPAVDRWRIVLPNRGSNEPLTVEFEEPLDFSLIGNTIWVVDKKSKVMQGSLRIQHEEHGFSFLPAQKWEMGQYTMKVESRLEDLAGNNLNRLFDTDISLPENKKGGKEVFERKFEVKAN